MPWVEFLRTLSENAWYAPRIKSISDKYPLEITPRPETFQIWGAIYYGIFISLLFTDHFDDQQSTCLFEESMRLNRKWVQSFAADNRDSANQTMKRLQKVNQELVVRLRDQGVNNFYIEMYTTWVNAESILNECIADYNDDDRKSVDTFYETIFDTYNNESLSYAEKITLQWVVQGINPKYRNQKFDFMKEVLLDNFRKVTLAELFGIENKSEEFFSLQSRVTPITKDFPPSFVRFGEKIYKRRDYPKQLEYNGYYYQLVTN